MNLSSLVGNGASKQEQSAEIQYSAQAVSPIVNGEVKLTIGKSSVMASALFDTVAIEYVEINSLSLDDYIVTVKTDSGDYTFSRMGEWTQRFYDALCDAYNKAVLRSLFISGNPVLTVNGDYRYTERGTTASGKAPVLIYENCVTILPPNLCARRIPLCFVTGFDKGDFELTLSLNTSEGYTFSKLGYDTAPFAEAVEKQIRTLQETSLSAVKDIDPSLTATQASQLAKLVPEGVAAPIGQLASIAPSFVASLEEKLSGTRAAESYTALKELCNLAEIYIGFRKNETGADSAGGLTAVMSGGNPHAALGSLTGGAPPADGEEREPAPPDPYLLWLIAPSPDGKYAAVEFAEADSATFLYKTGGDFDSFARQLNRALEAINFKREVIRMTDEELRKPENADYYMAAKRTASLQFIRGVYAGRVIHSSLESWERKLTESWNGTQAELKQVVPAQAGVKFCDQCGLKLTPGVKFCGKCGMKL